MMAKRKTHSASFKAKVAHEAIQGDLTVAELAAKYQVHPGMVTRWKKMAVEGMTDSFSRGGPSSRDADHQARIKELHAKIGELTVERDFLQKAFGR
jgi:transposase